MGPVRVAFVAGHRQQRAAPERRQLRKVRRPVDAGDVVEHWAEQRVLGDVGVEAPNHLGDLLEIDEIVSDHVGHDDDANVVHESGVVGC